MINRFIYVVNLPEVAQTFAVGRPLEDFYTAYSTDRYQKLSRNELLEEFLDVDRIIFNSFASVTLFFRSQRDEIEKRKRKIALAAYKKSVYIPEPIMKILKNDRVSPIDFSHQLNWSFRNDSKKIF